MKPRGLRGRLTLVVAVGATLLIAALVAGFNLVLRSSLATDADRVVRSRADSALETVAVGQSGIPRLIEAPSAQDAGVGVWVFGEGGTVLERPPAPRSIQDLADSLAGRDDEFRQSDAFDARLFALAVRDADGAQVGTVVAALSIEPYEATSRRALIASLIFAGAVLIGVLVAGRFLVGRALRPVARMTREATDWSEHDLDHRFAAGVPHDELTELAAAFDSMLDRLASSLRHEQRLSAEISHELRTPLAAIVAETELALARPGLPAAERGALSRVAARAAELQRILETLLAAARATISPEASRSRVAPVAERVLAGFAPLAADRGVRLGLVPGGEEVIAEVEVALLERILAPVVENACRFASTTVEATVAASGGRVAITIADDGPGVPIGDRERIFEAGTSGPAADPGSANGAGLGLSLARRLASAAGGELVAASPTTLGGAAFELKLPAAPARGASHERVRTSHY